MALQFGDRASGCPCAGRGCVHHRAAPDLDSAGIRPWLGTPAGNPVRARWATLIAVLACTSHPSPAPMPVSLDAGTLRPVTQFLDSVVAAGAAPGAVLALSLNGERFVYGTGQ